MEIILKQTITLFQLDPASDDLFDAVLILFNSKSKLYSHFPQKEPTRKPIDKIKQEKWRYRLKVGDKVDAIIGNSK